jgi:hypothetical protein
MDNPPYCGEALGNETAPLQQTPPVNQSERQPAKTYFWQLQSILLYPQFDLREAPGPQSRLPNAPFPTANGDEPAIVPDPAFGSDLRA